MAQIDRLIRGHVSQQTFQIKRGGQTLTQGPYFLLQRRENGKNNCQRVGTELRADEEDFDPRPKAVLLTLGWITLRRAYFYSAQRQEGRFALDAALGLVESYFPGAARWMCRAAALADSYEAAS